MRLCISNLGLDPQRPEASGPCLEGNLNLAKDDSLFEHETKHFSGPKTSLNLILLDPITAADIARMAKSEEHFVHARIINNIFSENVTPRNIASKILNLTQMELLVFALLSENYTYVQIANILNVEKETTKSHGHRIHLKTGLKTKLQFSQAFTSFKVQYPGWRHMLKESYRIYCP